MIGWENTRSALGKLEELLTCKVCTNLVSDPCSLEACDHIFCRNCVEKLVGADSKCPECGAFAWVKNLKTNRQLANTVSMCTKIRKLVGSDDHDKSSSGDDDNNVTNKCDVALQEISCNNKKQSKEPTQTKNLSRKTQTNTAAKRDNNGKEITKQGLCRELDEQDSETCPANEILASGQGFKEIVETSLSGSSKDEIRTQAKKKCFGKHLKKTRLIKKTCPVVTENDVHENKGQTDHVLTENIVTEQFEVTDEGGNNTDKEKDKENPDTGCFTRLRSKGPLTSDGSVMMQNKGPSHKGSPKAVESTPRTRAQKRNLRGTPQSSSLWTLPQNELQKNLTNERIHNEQVLMKKKKTEDTKETPLKSQGNRKRKMSEQTLSSPKNCILCPPEVKRNKRGETPLHVAAIKGCVETVRKLLAGGANPNTKDHAGWTPLHEACNHGYLTITELLLEHGAMINTPGGFDHDTPLHDAVTNGRVEVVSLLISRGAALNVRSHLWIISSMSPKKKYFRVGILKSLQRKTWVDETPFEVKGTNDAMMDAPKRARINSLKQLPGLFDGCQFFFNGEFIPPQPSKEDLVQLVKYGGGRILSREPKPDIDESLCLPRTPESNKASVTLAPVAYHADPDTKHYRCTQFIIYDSLAEKKPRSVCSMPSTWLMDCASNFQILTLE
ncbi:hypothetical protein pdam_00008176 [Pocillopora damicornis]|uniref:BRCA1-associated RING domain protein 1 n=1 Tax=Pocillopora damicornis TaxID=46731 RepID=A0A3M6TC24_POCDA|nr:hypothetical protein pdam_00008176 [Pocillopora damicornis]